MSELAAFEGGLSLAASLRASEALTGLVEERLPLQVAGGGGPPEPMRVIGPAMLARGAGTVQALAALAPLDREADAGVLLRVLLEHVITFAWLSADPDHQRFLLWLKEDGRQRLAMHNDLPSSVGALLSQRCTRSSAGSKSGSMVRSRTCANAQRKPTGIGRRAFPA